MRPIDLYHLERFDFLDKRYKTESGPEGATHYHKMGEFVVYLQKKPAKMPKLRLN